jgi:hypothetical protein
MVTDIESKKAEDIFADLEYGSDAVPQSAQKPESGGLKAEQQPEVSKEAVLESKPEPGGAVVKEPVKDKSMRAVASQPIAQAPAKADLVYQEVEKVLEEDLSDVYFKLPESAKAAFRQKGEETASKITLLLKSTKVKIKEVFKLIVVWLKVIPGINRFFLEQEAKIKTAKLISIKDKGLKK